MVDVSRIEPMLKKLLKQVVKQLLKSRVQQVRRTDRTESRADASAPAASPRGVASPSAFEATFLARHKLPLPVPHACDYCDAGIGY